MGRNDKAENKGRRQRVVWCRFRFEDSNRERAIKEEEKKFSLFPFLFPFSERQGYVGSGDNLVNRDNPQSAFAHPPFFQHPNSGKAHQSLTHLTVLALPQ